MMIDVDVDELMRDEAENQAEESCFPRLTSIIAHEFYVEISSIKERKLSEFSAIEVVIQPFLVRSRSFEQRQ